MKLSEIFIYLCLLSLISCTSTSDERNYWTGFRGSDGLGIDPGQGDEFSLTSSELKWSIELPGVGNASPVVWGKTIFVTSSDNENKSGTLSAVKERDGSVLWQKEFKLSDFSLHEDNNFAAATPAVDESSVYAIWYSNEKTILIALSHTGEMQWQSEFGGIVSRHGGGSSLMLTEKNIVFTREQEDFSPLTGSWVAVDRHTGETAWELKRESAEANSFSTPILVKTGRQESQLIFASQAHGITAVDPETGKILWERKDILTARVVASPVYSSGLIIACRKGEALVLKLNQETNLAADTILYALPGNLSPYVPTPIVVGDLLFLFMDGGTVACVRLATGELLWKERPAGPIYGSPVCIGENLYCITKAGKVIIIRAGSSYELMGIYELGDGSFSTPVVCNSGIVFRTFSKLVMYGNG